LEERECKKGSLLLLLLDLWERERERIIWTTWPIGASRTLDLIGDGWGDLEEGAHPST